MQFPLIPLQYEYILYSAVCSKENLSFPVAVTQYFSPRASVSNIAVVSILFDVILVVGRPTPGLTT